MLFRHCVCRRSVIRSNSIELAVSACRGFPPHPRGLSSRQVAGDSTNVRARPRPRCRRVTGHTRSSLGRRCTPGAPTRGTVTIPARAPRSPGAQLHSQDHCAPHRVECRAGGTVGAPIDRHRQRWSDDRRIPGAPCTAVPGDPRPAPDAFSAGTRRLGRSFNKDGPPHYSTTSSVAAFSCSHFAVPITEPVTRFVTEQQCHVMIRSRRSGRQRRRMAG